MEKEQRRRIPAANDEDDDDDDDDGDGGVHVCVFSSWIRPVLTTGMNGLDCMFARGLVRPAGH